jgi:hypothetical protein
MRKCGHAILLKTVPRPAKRWGELQNDLVLNRRQDFLLGDQPLFRAFSDFADTYTDFTSFGKNSLANVVLPAPLHPAIK